MTPASTDRDASLDAIVRTKKVIVCVGSGGVGKTTMSAAIALKAAAIGQRVCVLTIDPARRLANAMGLSAFSLKTLWRTAPSGTHANTASIVCR